MRAKLELAQTVDPDGGCAGARAPSRLAPVPAAVDLYVAPVLGIDLPPVDCDELEVRHPADRVPAAVQPARLGRPRDRRPPARRAARRGRPRRGPRLGAPLRRDVLDLAGGRQRQVDRARRSPRNRPSSEDLACRCSAQATRTRRTRPAASSQNSRDERLRRIVVPERFRRGRVRRPAAARREGRVDPVRNCARSPPYAPVARRDAVRRGTRSRARARARRVGPCRSFADSLPIVELRPRFDARSRPAPHRRWRSCTCTGRSRTSSCGSPPPGTSLYRCACRAANEIAAALARLNRRSGDDPR